ncbi:glycerol-3-phosphate 1-O-acyltransferase PlsY [Bacillus toyonensis]|uniref:glycerol-3-phosphate 1-O-acyltransferase PlsY n=1 Tax=Bacillus toyonensis TaxID=155322 RepID=UPI002E24226B|nr:glycerol-3-phosphate 1-O-acyltransferase PlsY [Bacillus toyonensis]
MSILILLISYILGSIPFALIVGIKFYNTDIRKHGSGNLGTTNTFRILGKKAGILVLIGDLGKGTIAAALPFLVGIDLHPIIPGVFAIVGHCYSLFAKFKGGKAVATTAGVILWYAPWIFLCFIPMFYLILKGTKYVSLTSSTLAYLLFIFSVITNDLYFTFFTFVILWFIVLKHRKNYIRIKNGTEPYVNL